MVLGLELGKLLAGWLDYRLRVIHHQQRIVAEANPVTMRMVDALERLTPSGLCATCGFPAFPGHGCPSNGAVDVMQLR
jgi:hypothetical protein